jgi:hypothetical protein
MELASELILALSNKSAGTVRIAGKSHFSKNADNGRYESNLLKNASNSGKGSAFPAAVLRQHCGKP